MFSVEGGGFGWDFDCGLPRERIDDMNRRTGIGLFAITALFILQGAAGVSQGLGIDGFQGTTYILEKSEAEVIIPANGTSFNLTLAYKSEIRLFDSLGNEVPVETSVQFWRGSHQYHIVSHRPVKGHLNYVHPISEQRFVAPVEAGESVRVVLPKGYATGDRILGKARPEPDDLKSLEGRTALIWTDLQKRTFIDVNFYREDAPRAFRLFLLLLAFIAGVIVLEHNMSIKHLRSFREDAEIERDELGRPRRDDDEKNRSDAGRSRGDDDEKNRDDAGGSRRDDDEKDRDEKGRI